MVRRKLSLSWQNNYNTQRHEREKRKFRRSIISFYFRV